MLENLSFLIVSPEPNSRMKLREILKTFIYKGTITYERSLPAVVEILATPGPAPCDALFLASSFGSEDIIQFVSSAQAKNIKLPSIIVYITNSELDKSSEIASLYLHGVDGFISEPYTADALLSLIEIVQAKKAKSNDVEIKQKKALEFLLYDTMSHVDELARQRLKGESSGGFILKSLRDTSKNLSVIAEQNLDTYAEALTDAFEKAKPFPGPSVDRSGPKVSKKRVVHPGALAREIMETRKITKEKVLSLIKMPPEEFDQLLGEKIPLTDTYAREISRALGLSSREWMKMQRDYDLMIKAQEKAK